MANYIHEVNTNDTLYQLFLEHKLAKNKISNKDFINVFERNIVTHDYEHLIPAFACYVCDMMLNGRGFAAQKHNSVYNCPVKQAVGSDASSWESHWKMGACEIKAFRHFTEKLRISNFTEAMFANQTIKYFIADNCDL